MHWGKNLDLNRTAQRSTAYSVMLLVKRLAVVLMLRFVVSFIPIIKT
jgi:hypothetical protein